MKMDTVIDERERERGAAVAAGVLQKESRREPVGSKPSVVSPIEERLAAGISTIRLQTKRLMGAQQKKLIKARKAMEGTWTVEKSPSETPSQEKGVAGSSEVMKRPHSHSSTPPSTKQQPNKPRSTQEQTGSYKEAVFGTKMAVIHKHHPEVKLDQAEVDHIQGKILVAVDANPLGEAPLQFLHSKFAQGIFWINCANKSSKVWLM
jgi:hypothetical protein